LKNPILELIEKKGLSPREFGITYGCTIASIRNVIFGYVDKVPKGIKNVLQKCGFDTSNIDEEYREWLEFKFKKGGI